MCGICGINWNDEALVRRMADSMTHRGPDQSGTYAAEGVSLGHRRLSIIDLSDDGRQPLGNEDGAFQLVFNGEIYNFAELKTELEARGHRFRSHTDSEVIVHAYEEYGAECVHKLRGMFAFAVWDRARATLFAARDRIGIKPFYYVWRNGRLAFGSEIKALLEVPDVPRELNHQALYAYMGFEFVPAPDTMFRHIRKLPAGHCLTLRAGELAVREYWDLRLAAAAAPPSRAAAVEQERALLDYAVKSHLVSDVPLGVFLSGGLDSSAIVAMMRRHISGPLRTFTIGYSDPSFSELDYARRVAEQFETEHHVLMLDEITAADVERTLWHLDEPMTDLSAIPLYFACRKAREHITVCLSGEGGDESFAGYDRFKASRINRVYGHLPRALRERVVAPLVARLPDQAQKKGAVNMLKRFIEGSVLPPDGAHLRWQYFSNAARDAALFSDRFKREVVFDPFARLREHAARCDATDVVNREVYLDMRYMMTDSVLMKVDRMSMAHALEIRVPLLDHVLVEFIAGLPGDWKLEGLRTKAILRSALKGILPDTIVERGKQGYSLPVKALLRNQLKAFMVTVLNESEIVRTHCNRDTVSRLIREHLAMEHNHNHVLWGLINVALWQRRFKVSV
jgi:asparagine synthase (glutamine-hydrolysing)